MQQNTPSFTSDSYSQLLHDTFHARGTVVPNTATVSAMPSHPVGHVFLTLQWNSLGRASFEGHEGRRGKTRCVLLHFESSKRCVCPLYKFLQAFKVVKLFLKHPVFFVKFMCKAHHEDVWRQSEHTAFNPRRSENWTCFPLHCINEWRVPVCFSYSVRSTDNSWSIFIKNNPINGSVLP